MNTNTPDAADQDAASTFRWMCKNLSVIMVYVLSYEDSVWLLDVAGCGYRRGSVHAFR
jgi:hypothetical protein